MCAEQAGHTGGHAAACCGAMRGSNEAGDATEACPMASFLKEMANKPGLGPLLLIPGLIFILGGGLVLIAPSVLLWLLAGTSFVLGLSLLLIGRAIARFVTGPRLGPNAP